MKEPHTIVFAFRITEAGSGPDADAVGKRLAKVAKYLIADEGHDVDVHHLADVAACLEDMVQVLRRAKASQAGGSTDAETQEEG